jgi:hypothetical protein
MDGDSTEFATPFRSIVNENGNSLARYRKHRLKCEIRNVWKRKAFSLLPTSHVQTVKMPSWDEEPGAGEDYEMSLQQTKRGQVQRLKRNQPVQRNARQSKPSTSKPTAKKCEPRALLCWDAFRAILSF